MQRNHRKATNEPPSSLKKKRQAMTTESVKSGEAIAEGSVKPQHKGSKQNKTKHKKQQPQLQWGFWTCKVKKR
jgi:hypothetical protein